MLGLLIFGKTSNIGLLDELGKALCKEMKLFERMIVLEIGFEILLNDCDLLEKFGIRFGMGLDLLMMKKRNVGSLKCFLICDVLVD
jgi:hypothetical protein